VPSKQTDDHASSTHQETAPHTALPEYGAAPQEFPDGWDEFVVARSRYLRARELADGNAPDAGPPQMRSRFAPTRQHLLT
jgi:hypothetical protein